MRKFDLLINHWYIIKLIINTFNSLINYSYLFIILYILFGVIAFINYIT